MRTKHCFNMVEILLALGVCAIGVCSIMVLFPVGAAATRDAAMETYAAHAADQMLHYLKYRIVQSNANWIAVIGDDPSSGLIDQTEDPDIDTSPPDTTFTFTLEQLNDPNIWLSTSSLTFDDLRGTVYQCKETAPNGNRLFFQIISHRNPPVDSGPVTDDIGKPRVFDSPSPCKFDFSLIDFRALATVWKEPVVVQTSDPEKPITLGYDMAVKLNIKATWPAELPERARQSSLYSIEVFNPNYEPTP